MAVGGARAGAAIWPSRRPHPRTPASFACRPRPPAGAVSGTARSSHLSPWHGCHRVYSALAAACCAALRTLSPSAAGSVDRPPTTGRPIVYRTVTGLAFQEALQLESCAHPVTHASLISYLARACCSALRSTALILLPRCRRSRVRLGRRVTLRAPRRQLRAQLPVAPRAPVRRLALLGAVALWARGLQAAVAGRANETACKQPQPCNTLHAACHTVPATAATAQSWRGASPQTCTRCRA